MVLNSLLLYHKLLETTIVQVFTNLNEFSKTERGVVLTVGNFDGVHKGHQAIITQARQLADAESLPLVAFTFDPPPLKFFRPDRILRTLTPLEMKISLLRRFKVDILLVVEPTEDFMNLSAQDYAKQIIVDAIGARHVVEGQTFSFGRHRSGTIVSLQRFGREFGYETHLVPACTISLDDTHSVAISSTLIRQQISTSRVDLAGPCLGRLYTLLGAVVRGRGQGRTLGFPTANIQMHSSDQLVPEDGVFAGYARFGDDLDQAWASDKPYRAAVSIGRCETFPDSEWQIEAYLIDYPERGPSLLEKTILLSMVEKIRPQFRYDTPQALARAIEADCRDINKILQRKGTRLL